MNTSENGNLSTTGQLHWVIDQTPLFVFMFSLNIFLAFTATIGNTLILIALHKVSSIHPPTKFLLRCLAVTDFCVGVIVQPLFAAFLMEIERGKWYILYMILTTLNFTFCGFSLTTATVICVDRLTVTSIEIQTHSNFKTSLLPCYLPLGSCNGNWFYMFLVFSKRGQQRRICRHHNFLFRFGLLPRQNLSQTATAPSPSTTTSWT